MLQSIAEHHWLDGRALCYGSIHCGVGLWRVPFIIILLLSLFSVIVCPSSSAPRFFALRPSVLLAVSPIFGRNRVNTVCFPSKKYSSIFRCLPTHRSRTASAAHEIWELIAWVSFSCLCILLRDFISSSIASAQEWVCPFQMLSTIACIPGID